MNVYIIIGLEGCGHHGYTPIIRELVGTSSHEEVGGMQQKKILSTCCNNLYDFDTFENIVYDFFKSTDNHTHLVDTSFPSGPGSKHRSLGNQLLISKMYETLSKHANVHIIHLRRNIYNTINSHPEWNSKRTHDIYTRAEELINIEKHIIDELNILEQCGVDIHIIDYEDIDSTIGVNHLATLTSRPKSVVRRHIRKMFKRSTKDYKKILDSNVIRKLEDIVNNLR